ncbi:MAG TPA: pyruvate kinase [Kofleriaceae bacterium]|nr:pyruvate kinase [Kofleriaceae bacterium]
MARKHGRPARKRQPPTTVCTSDRPSSSGPACKHARVKRRTKILATLGPASQDPAVLDAMIAAGLDAVRLNFSHGTHEGHAETYRRVREAAARAGREIAILQDLQGPKIRLGKIDGELHVETGSQLVITTRDIVGKPGLVPTDYKLLPRDVSVGMKILLDEGRVAVAVRAVEDGDVLCTVTDGGVLVSKKGLSVPGATLTAAAMTDKDKDDVAFGLELGVDYVALSFVRRPSDVEDLRRVMHERGRVVPIIAKIEKPQAVDAIDDIVAVADGVMVARGDLAIESTLEMIPAHQKKIIDRANRAGKLVITATQMLESMTDNPLPTRAEVTDVANAVLDGTDAVMLSGETAVGKYPVEAVRRMGSIAEATEETLYPFERRIRPAPDGDDHDTLARVNARIAAQAARETNAAAILVFTDSGATAGRVSDERPRAPILAFTRELSTQRRLALYWGVHPLPMGTAQSSIELAERGEKLVVDQRWAGSAETIVFVFGSHLVHGADHSVSLRRIP